MRSAIVLACACVGLACTPAGKEPSGEESPASLEPESLAPPTGAWVVIDERSGLFQAPGGTKIPIEATEPVPRWRVAEVVGIEQGFIELRTIARTSAWACTGGRGYSF